MLNVWIDTDIGDDIDDAVALLVAARHPQLRLVGVSTVYGPVMARAWLAGELLRCLGSKAPVFPGAAMPLRGSESSLQATSYLRLVPPDVFSTPPGEDGAAISVVAEAMLALAEPFHLVTIGAMTNAARLIRDHPEVRKRWLGVTCMGGRLEEDPEYNVWCDHEAAAIVFRETAPRVVGLEASSHTLPRAEVEALVSPTAPPSGPRGVLSGSQRGSGAFLLDCYREYREYRAHREDPPLTLYDPITVLSLAHPEAFDFQSLRVLVEGEGRLRLTDDGYQVQYALSSDWPRLKPVVADLLGKA